VMTANTLSCSPLVQTPLISAALGAPLSRTFMSKSNQCSIVTLQKDMHSVELPSVPNLTNTIPFSMSSSENALDSERKKENSVEAEDDLTVNPKECGTRSGPIKLKTIEQLLNPVKNKQSACDNSQNVQSDRGNISNMFSNSEPIVVIHKLKNPPSLNTATLSKTIKDYSSGPITLPLLHELRMPDNKCSPAQRITLNVTTDGSIANHKTNFNAAKYIKRKSNNVLTNTDMIKSSSVITNKSMTDFNCALNTNNTKGIAATSTDIPATVIYYESRSNLSSVSIESIVEPECNKSNIEEVNTQIIY